MNFAALFIRRPVLSIVVSLMILVLGVRAFMGLPVRDFPRIVSAVVTVNTTYYGADPDVIAGFITAPLEAAVAQADGIDYMTSSSRTGFSTITANLRLNYDPNVALSEISTKVNAVINQLPPAAQQPTLQARIGQVAPSLIIVFRSKTMATNQVTDYLMRVVVPRFQAVAGVQAVNMVGNRTLALRAWLDPNKLAAYGLTAAQVSEALAANNYLSGLGTTKGQMQGINLNASTDLHTKEEFENLAIKEVNGATVRLKDVAEVTIGAEDYDSDLLSDGNPGVVTTFEMTPSSNMLGVIADVKKLLPDIEAQLPPGMEVRIVNDGSEFVTASIHEVVITLLEALGIVTLVIFVFLGSLRSSLIPVVAIPLSLVGTFFMMLIFGFTINLLTLLAFVLAIGLVVDDAIIVVENVNRHLEEGLSAMDASFLAVKELAGPIVAMAAVLIAVYVPIGFQSGLTGALFTEFAFTLVGAVAVSSVVALTLTPMMCSRLLMPHSAIKGWEGRFIHIVDRMMDRLADFYRRLLHDSLKYLSVTLIFALLIFASVFALYATSRSELAPPEDKGNININITWPPGATQDQKVFYSKAVYEKVSQYPSLRHVTQAISLTGMNFTSVRMLPWEQRKITFSELFAGIQKDLATIPGIRGAAFLQPPLPASGNFAAPMQFVIGSTESYDRMGLVVDNLVQQAQASGMFSFMDTDLKMDLPRATLQIDRDKAAQLGLSMRDVGSGLSAMLSGAYVNYFALAGRSYKVIPQVEQQFRLNADQLLNYHIKAPQGTIPLSTVASIETKAVPQALNHFQQLNSVTVSGMLTGGVLLGDALAYMRDLAAQTLPTGYSVDYAGQSRQYMQESSGFIITFVFALVIITLVLAALFESFRDPIIIMVSVPMSMAGALLFINLGVGGATINLYTQVGLVTLMGLISKHGILIVRFANDLQREGYSKREAVELAASIRLRPILMTTAAMVLGILPLVFASGAGAAARYNLGIVITTGISIGTLFTLFVVPAVYVVLAAKHEKLEPATDLSATDFSHPSPRPAE